jgi:hypothetical protein
MLARLDKPLRPMRGQHSRRAVGGDVVAIARRNDPVLQMKTGFARSRYAGDATFIETIGTA